MSQSIRRTYQPSFERLERRDAPSAFGAGMSILVRHQVGEVVHHHRHHGHHHPEVHHHPGEVETHGGNGRHGEAGAHA